MLTSKTNKNTKEILKITVFMMALFLGFSCSTTPKKSANRISSKVIYSLMVKDPVGLESVYSTQLKKKFKGAMFIQAISALEKQKGKMEGIEFVERKGSDIYYQLYMKEGKSNLKLKFDSNNKLEQVWIDESPLTKG